MDNTSSASWWAVVQAGSRVRAGSMNKKSDAREAAREPETGRVPAWIRDHLRRYIESNGADGHYFDLSAVGASGLMPSLLLTTKGRRSGQHRTMPLFYGEATNGYVVIGSKGGSDAHPAWYLNLLANPGADVQVGAARYSVRARTAEGEERSRLWNQMVTLYPTYAGLQQATRREIPVVVLERV